MVKTKTREAVELFNQGDYKKSLRLFQKFRIGFTKEEKDKLRMAHEIESGFDSFWRQLGFNTETVKKEAREIIKQYCKTYYER